MKRTILAVAVVLLFVPSAMGQQRTGKGAVLGGATGAVIGGIIGHQNDEVPEGALIGGAVGAIAGGLIGRVQDNQIAQQRYQQQQAYQQRVYVQQQAVVATGMSTADVLALARSGVSESLIISQLSSRGVQRRLEVHEIISLHQQGVSDNVISYMQNAPLASQLAAPTRTQVVTQSTPVIVQQHPVIYQQQPVVVGGYYQPVPVYHHRHHYHSGSSPRYGF